MPEKASSRKTKKINGVEFVLRKSYKKKSYKRKAHTRRTRNGKLIKVKATKVGPVSVKSSWIKKQGLTNKYGLIPLKDTRHLTKFGYHFNKSSLMRKIAIQKAIKKYGRNWVVRRLTALANIRPKLAKYKTLVKKAKSDVKYVKDVFPSKTSIKKQAKKTRKKF